MVSRIRHAIAAPLPDDEEQRRVARLLTVVVLALLAAAVLALVIMGAVYGVPSDEEQAFTFGSAAFLALLMLGLLILARRGYLRIASIILLSSLWAIMSYWIVTVSGISSDSGVMVFPLIIVLAGLLLGGRAALAYTALSVLVALAAYYAEARGLLVVVDAPLSIVDPLIMCAALVLTGLLLLYAMNGMLGALERARTNERAQVAANRELEAMRQSLEQRVSERTADLERRSVFLQTALEVSRAATSVLNPEELVWQVAQLIRERFALYHVGVFRVDATGQWAEYRAGAGAGEKALAEEGFRLEVGGESMVGWCTAHAQARVSQDVSDEAARHEHPQVPHTCSEAALPLIARGQVLGALSVQSERVGTFDDQLVASLQTMADQVAVALDNARLFAESQAALEAARRAYGEFSRQAWSEMLHARGDWGLVYAHETVVPAREGWWPEMSQARQTGIPVTGGGDVPTLAIPLQVRDQVIGALGFTKGRAGEEWTAEEKELLQALVQQLGVALESAQLFEETQQRAARDRMLGEVTSRIRETLDVDTVLQTAVREMREALGITEVEVFLDTGER